jgi:hypothetical protein
LIILVLLAQRDTLTQRGAHMVLKREVELEHLGDCLTKMEAVRHHIRRTLKK